MLTRRNILAAVIGLAATALTPLNAFAATWVLLGSRTVNLLADHDTIRVGAGAGLFTHIRLRVTGNTVFVDRLRVVFVNGGVADIPLRFLFLPGTYSRAILLPGVVRRIRRVEMTYSKLIGGGTAVVTIEGRNL